jgi:serine/threonine protein kinase
MISVPYSAPEITNTSPIDARTDIYSLGVIILVMIVGLPNEQINKIQHYNESTIAITNTLKEQNIDREEYIKESIKKIINEQLKRTLLKCLTNNINERFKNITELKKALITIHEKLEN